MTKHTLQVQPRTVTGRKVKTLRRQNLTPAHLFGNALQPISLQVSTPDFLHTYHTVGESSLLYLELPSESSPRPVFVKAVSFHPLTGQLLHVSFHQVDLTAKVTAPVAINLTGESLAVKDGLGVLVQQLDEVQIEALPTDMPEHIDVDISSLAAVGDHVMVKDLSLDRSKLAVQTDPESVVVKIEALAKEEVVETTPEVAPENLDGSTPSSPSETPNPSEATPAE